MIRSNELDLGTVKNSFSQTTEIFLAFLCVLAGTIISFIRWHYLLLTQKISIKLKDTISYSFIGLLFNTVAFGKFGGDVVKAWHLIRKRNKEETKTSILLSVIMDRLIGLSGLLLVSAIAAIINIDLIWSNEPLRNFSIIVISFPISLTAFYLLFYRKNSILRNSVNRQAIKFFPSMEPFVVKLHQSWLLYRNKSKTLLLCLLSAIVTHFFTVTAVLFCARSIENSFIHLYELFLFSPIGLLIASLPIAPEGIGVGQLAFSKLFSVVNYDSGGELFTLFISIQISINLIGIIFYLLHKKESNKPLRAQK